MENYKKLEKCRVCSSKDLISVLNLGRQVLTGVFPKNRDDKITTGPMELVLCRECSLLQLNHSYSLDEMYGENYGYRSGLNASMVVHLTNKILHLQKYAEVKSGDTVLDIGSNDATSLKAYNVDNITKIGIDPIGNKFKEYYTDDMQLVPDFFTSKNFKTITDKKAKIVTSISMFYDLEDPVQFAKEIEEILDDNGLWHFEQSYMPSMLRMNAYDTICHEHLEYYSLNTVKYIVEKANLKIVDVVMNSVNGGSFAVTATKKSNTSLTSNDSVINWLLEQENRMELHTPKPYRDFEEKVFKHREDLVRLIKALNDAGKTVVGYGASTKGNVLLQFCNFDENSIKTIAEVNVEKFGSYTPGTLIPIVSEEEAKVMDPDYFLVLPWHFKDTILKREKEYSSKGGKFIFPCPEIEII